MEPRKQPMLPIRVQRDQEKDRINWGRRLKCTKCGLVMRDLEPMCHAGEFWHSKQSKVKLKKVNGDIKATKKKSTSAECPNAGLRFTWELQPYYYDFATGAKTKRQVRKGKHVSGIVQLISKRDQRARRRGAKLASKHRPK